MSVTVAVTLKRSTMDNRVTFGKWHTRTVAHKMDGWPDLPLSQSISCTSLVHLVTVLSSGQFYQCTDDAVRGAGYVRALRTAEGITAVRSGYM